MKLYSVLTTKNGHCSRAGSPKSLGITVRAHGAHTKLSGNRYTQCELSLLPRSVSEDLFFQCFSQFPRSILGAVNPIVRLTYLELF